MDNSTPSFDIKTTTKDPPIPILKSPVAFGNDVMAIALNKLIVKHFQITEDTVFQQQIVEDGILLRIVKKCSSFQA